MFIITKELKAKLLAAQDVNEVTALLKAEGQGISPEDAERLWEEILRKREKDGKELSLDELEAVSGGRDYETEGCAATVEPDSLCWSDDECFLDEVSYQHPPRKKLCPRCGHGIATYQYTHLFVAHYWCQGCHNPFEVTEIF